MKEKELQPSAAILMESTRAIGYSLETAIADVIDNSISANAGRVDITYDMERYGQAYIAITDNGEGMTDAQLYEAMRYGTQSPKSVRAKNDLGRYGLGMKTASLSQCRKLTVVSKKDKQTVGYCWDLDHVIATDRWEVLQLNEQEIAALKDIDILNGNDSGTMVLWEKLDKLFTTNNEKASSLGQEMVDVDRHLSLVFHRYLTGEPGLKKLGIFLNKRPLEPADPFFVAKSRHVMDETPFEIGKEHIYVKPFVLPPLSTLKQSEIDRVGGSEGLRKTQGFYVYRNKRLVIWGTWFLMRPKGELSKYARIRVDIPNSLDELWSLDIKKSKAEPPAVLKEALRKFMQTVASHSIRQTEFRGRREASQSDLITAWCREKTREGFAYRINRDYPLIKKRIDEHRWLEPVLRLIEEQLPLNALYADLVGDHRISNGEVLEKEQEVVKILKGMLCPIKDPGMRRFAFSEYLKVLPFSEHREELEKLKQEIISNE